MKNSQLQAERNGSKEGKTSMIRRGPKGNGRVPVQHKRENKITFRLTLFERRMVEVRAKRCNMTLAMFCRETALGSKITERFTEEHLQAYRMLVGYHGKFDKIAEFMGEGDPALTHEIREVMTEIRNHLLSFSK